MSPTIQLRLREESAKIIRLDHGPAPPQLAAFLEALEWMRDGPHQWLRHYGRALSSEREARRWVYDVLELLLEWAGTWRAMDFNRTTTPPRVAASADPLDERLALVARKMPGTLEALFALAVWPEVEQAARGLVGTIDETPSDGE